MKIVFTELAEDDLIDIWVHIALDNESAADRLVDEIHEATRRLLQFPLMGREADRLHSGARSLTLRDYLIVYRPTDYGIAVLRAVHGSRDIAVLLYPEPPAA
jgi:toxin ParE1/3/4